MSDNVHLYAGAYALDALHLDERALYERHLVTCDMCRLEVGGYQETAARLGAAAATRSPRHLRADVMAAAAATRQLSPGMAAVQHWRVRIRPFLLPVAAGLAAAVLGLGGVSTYLYDHNQDMRAELSVAEAERELSQLLADAVQVPLEAPAGIAASFVHSQADDRGILVVEGLGELDAAHAYQLWLIHDGTPVPAGVFSASDGSPAVVTAEAQVSGAERVAVTVEPAGGAPAPTGAILMSGRL